MVETLYTKDSKYHTLLGSTTPVSIIREYCGDEVADWAARLYAQNATTEKLVSRIQALEAELESAYIDLSDANEEIESLGCKIDYLEGDKEL